MPALQITPTQSQVQQALRSFLLAVLPPGVDAAESIDNLVSEPSATSFVIMSPLRSERLETNVDSFQDVRFTGSINGTTMVVSAINFGTILVGATVFGVGVAAGTVITAQTAGPPGGLGNYTVSIAQTIAPGTVLSSGAQTFEDHEEIVFQLDFHAPDSSAKDMAQTVSTLFRDDFAVQQFLGQSPSFNVAPLYADDPRFLPFANAEQQMEWRWVVEAHLQVNHTISVPQQFADAVTVVPVSVQAAYGP